MTEAEKMGDPHFLALVQNLHVSVFIHLGKLEDPSAGKAAVNLEAAKATIDTLRMLQEKTAGNRTEGEEKLLEHVLFEAQMNYIDEVGKGEGKEEADKEESKSSPPDVETDQTEVGAPDEGS